MKYSDLRVGQWVNINPTEYSFSKKAYRGRITKRMIYTDKIIWVFQGPKYDSIINDYLLSRMSLLKPSWLFKIIYGIPKRIQNAYYICWQKLS